MNSTSFEPRQSHSQYAIASLPAPATTEQSPGKSQAKALNLTSSPKFSFKAPTTEDFDKGTRTLVDEPGPGATPSLFANLWKKLSWRQ
ncbi:hypothetical protein [Pseudomonas orientalis]|uniref:hypothetical protein n=1 Tax=Pseudomonas orientalis TaxID=76758 RepID=UPI0019D2D360|nr:hypothetical protein [Pseudomonas orientalis]